MISSHHITAPRIQVKDQAPNGVLNLLAQLVLTPRCHMPCARAGSCVLHPSILRYLSRPPFTGTFFWGTSSRSTCPFQYRQNHSTFMTKKVRSMRVHELKTCLFRAEDSTLLICCHGPPQVGVMVAWYPASPQ